MGTTKVCHIECMYRMCLCMCMLVCHCMYSEYAAKEEDVGACFYVMIFQQDIGVQ